MIPPPDGHVSLSHQSLYPGVPSPRESQNYVSHLRLKKKGFAKRGSPESSYNAFAVQADKLSPPIPVPPSADKKSSVPKEEEGEVENGIDVRFIPPSEEYIGQAPSQRRIRHWIKAQGKIVDPLAHVMALAYMSDSFLLGTAMIANDVHFSDMSMMVSLDHTIYFHKPPKADEWLMHCVESPWTGDDRGLVVGRFFSLEGDHVATVIQEGLLRLSDSAQRDAKL